MKKIILHGALRKKFGREHLRDVKTGLQAVSALSATIPGFRDHLFRHSKPGYRVFVGEREAPLERLSMITSAEVIRIVPVVRGGGGDSPFGIILGIALIAGSGGFGGAFAVLSGAGAKIGMSLGISLALGGVSALISGSPDTNRQTPQRPQNLPSFGFNGAVNLTEQGNAVPLCYGELIVGSQVISAGLHAEQLTVTEAGKEEPTEENTTYTHYVDHDVTPPITFQVPDHEDYLSDVGAWLVREESETQLVKVEMFTGEPYEYIVDEETGTYELPYHPQITGRYIRVEYVRSLA